MHLCDVCMQLIVGESQLGSLLFEKAFREQFCKLCNLLTALKQRLRTVLFFFDNLTKHPPCNCGGVLCVVLNTITYRSECCLSRR